jgi:hypothetical protein
MVLPNSTAYLDRLPSGYRAELTLAAAKNLLTFDAVLGPAPHLMYVAAPVQRAQRKGAFTYLHAPYWLQTLEDCLRAFDREHPRATSWARSTGAWDIRLPESLFDVDVRAHRVLTLAPNDRKTHDVILRISTAQLLYRDVSLTVEYHR